MDAKTGTADHPASLSGDLWGGLASMLVALPASIAYGVLAYSGLGGGYAAAGALAGLLGAAALGLVAPLVGRTRGLISAPCAPAAAVLSGMVASLAGGHSPLSAEEILPLLALTALFSAFLQVLYGLLGGGRLIKYVPYPVVSGYLAGVGVLIALGQAPKLLGLPAGASLWEGLASPEQWRWPGVVVGLVTIGVMAAAPRLTRKVPAAILGLAAGMATYLSLGWFVPGLLRLEGNPLLIGPILTSGSFLDSLTGRLGSLLTVDLHTVEAALMPAFTLSVLLSIDTLKTGVILDTLTRQRHDSNRALVGQGAANLTSFVVGGMPGSGTLGPTLVNLASGGRGSRAGVIEGGLVILATVALGGLIAWVPISALAGILLVVSWRMFDWHLFRLLRYPAGRQDFAVIAAVVLVAVLVDLIAAAGVGVGMAILLFIRDQVHGSVIRHKRYLNEISSKTRRLSAERNLLRQHGDQGVCCELQGNLFFGTADQLLSHLEADLRTRRFVLFDLRRVQSLDYTAAHLFEQMQALLAERDGRLLFSGMPSALPHQQDLERYLIEVGLVRDGAGVMIAETMDSALEWMEEQILQAAGARPKDDEQPLELAEIDLFRGLDSNLLARLAPCLRRLSVAAGEKVFSHGDRADEIFLIRQGSVRIMLPLERSRRHHLATIGRGDFFGELSFLDRGVRSADVEAKTPTELFALSRTRFDEWISADSGFGVEVFSRLALSIAERLRHTDLELRSLEER